MTYDGFNIVGKSKTLEPAQRHNRAFDGIKIAMRSKNVRRALKDVKGDDVGNEVKKRVKETIEKAVKLDDQTTKEDVFEKLNKNFDDLYKDVHKKDINDAGIDIDQAKNLFNKVKEEANIVASSRKAMLFAGKITSRLSQIPLIGHAVSGMSSLMRSMTKMLGDKDANKEENGKTILDISSATASHGGLGRPQASSQSAVPPVVPKDDNDTAPEKPDVKTAGAKQDKAPNSGAPAEPSKVKGEGADKKKTEAVKQDETPNSGAPVEPPKATAQDAKLVAGVGSSNADGNSEQNTGQKDYIEGVTNIVSKKLEVVLASEYGSGNINSPLADMIKKEWDGILQNSEQRTAFSKAIENIVEKKGTGALYNLVYGKNPDGRVEPDDKKIQVTEADRIKNILAYAQKLDGVAPEAGSDVQSEQTAQSGAAGVAAQDRPLSEEYLQHRAHQFIEQHTRNIEAQLGRVPAGQHQPYNIDRFIDGDEPITGKNVARASAAGGITFLGTPDEVTYNRREYFLREAGIQFMAHAGYRDTNKFIKDYLGNRRNERVSDGLYQHAIEFCALAQHVGKSNLTSAEKGEKLKKLLQRAQIGLRSVR